jgi:hypothetical protein
MDREEWARVEGDEIIFDIPTWSPDGKLRPREHWDTISHRLCWSEMKTKKRREQSIAFYKARLIEFALRDCWEEAITRPDHRARWECFQRVELAEARWLLNCIAD